MQNLETFIEVLIEFCLNAQSFIENQKRDVERGK